MNQNYFKNTLAKEPRVARGKKQTKKHLKYFLDFLALNTHRPPMSVPKNVSPIGPAVLQHIYTYECLVLFVCQKSALNECNIPLILHKKFYLFKIKLRIKCGVQGFN